METHKLATSSGDPQKHECEQRPTNYLTIARRYDSFRNTTPISA